MKLSDLLDALLGADITLDIPLPPVSTQKQAEVTQEQMMMACPRFDFALTLRGKHWILVVSRRLGKVRVPYAC